MRFQERHPGQDPGQGPGGEPGGEGRDLGRMRAEGQRFLDAGDEAIDKALSADSEWFLRAIRQQSGE